jgi:cytochrome c biogenesis protein CcdA/thiol-disulfide isomerase/thioredoxin
MILLLLFAFLAGIVTILSPCILPLLPIVLSGTTGGGKARPWGIITGFVVSFTAFTLALTALVSLLGISADILRWIAGAFVIAFGLIMIIPPLKNLFTRLASRAVSGGVGPQEGPAKTGYWSGLALGVSLGLVWTPCVGPIMASVIALALTTTVDLGSVLITLFYSLGTAVPLFIIMQGGRTLLKKVPFLSRNSERIQRVFGVLMIFTGLAVVIGWDRQFQTMILNAFPGYGTGLTSIENQAFISNAITSRENNLNSEGTPGSVPANAAALDAALQLGGTWINSQPLGAAGLEGKVVLIDFWTYSCINCIRTFPYLKAWDVAYRDKGLVIIGVHSPEFAFEREEANVRRAVADFDLAYPVVQDNDYKIWSAFHNLYWPAHYFFDRTGNLVSRHAGEGGYEESEKLIQTLLATSGALASGNISPTLPTTLDRTPETYLGSLRVENFRSLEAGAVGEAQDYSIPENLPRDGWALAGKWIREQENIRALGQGALALNFRAQKVYLVLGPAEGSAPPEISVTVDGSAVNTVDVKDGKLKFDTYRLYVLYDGAAEISGVLKVETSGPLKAYAFTFG